MMVNIFLVNYLICIRQLLSIFFIFRVLFIFGKVQLITIIRRTKYFIIISKKQILLSQNVLPIVCNAWFEIFGNS